jgi:transcriptional regulator
MYVPKSFAIEDKPTFHAFMQANSFATLVTMHGGVPFATHLPLLLKPELGERGVLRGHVARANPQWKSMETQEALVVFQGPHAYISPSWYGTEAVVPTWNYTAVHAYGVPRLFDQEEELSTLLHEMVQVYEGGQPFPWSMKDAPDDYIQKLVKAIVGFEIEITRLEGKFKLGQNRPMEEQARVISHLRSLEDPQSDEVAALMEANAEGVGRF